MASPIHIRVLLALAFVTLVLASGADAAQEGCAFRNGTPRACTTSEKFLRCIDGTVDAYFQCISDRTSGEPGSFGYALGATVCQGWLAVDQAFCVAKILKM